MNMYLNVSIAIFAMLAVAVILSILIWEGE